MPRTSNQNYEAHPKQQFTHITIEQLQKLQAINLSGFQTRVWMALKLYAWNNKTCFPSLDSIADRIGLHTKTRRQQVSNALKALVAYGLIERNHHRQKPDRFVLQKLHSCKPNDETSCKPNDEQKQTQRQTNSQTPTPLEKGEDKEKSESLAPVSKKQRVRASRRRKRLRKQDRMHIQAIKEEQTAAKTKHQQAIADYKQAVEDAPKVLDALLDLHENKDTPKTPEEATRTFFIAATLKHCDWIDEQLERPPHLQMCSQLYDEFTQDITWKLRMSMRELWEFVLRDEQLQKQITS